MNVSKHRRLSLAVMFGIVVTVGMGASVPRAHAEQPILIGMGVAQTGALAGGGKSALLAEAAASSDDWTVLRTTGVEAESIR